MRFEEREMICLKKGDISQFGMLHVPVGDGPFPTVIICHGFMGDHIGRQGIYVELATRLSKLNIATLRMSFIGCGDSEGNIKKESVHSQINQVLQRVEYIAGDPRLDASKLGVLGNSLGGVVSCLSIPKIESVKCLVTSGSIAKGSLWLEEWEKGNPGKKARNEFFYDDETYNEFAKMEPVNLLKENKKFPALVIHGENDDIVSRSHYDLFCKNINPHCKTLLLENVGHYFGVGYQRAVYLDEISQWMKKHLNSEEQS